MDNKIFLSLSLILLYFNSPAQTVWYVTPQGAGTQSGKNWPNASGSLQAAIDSAGNGDEIWVAAGKYVPSVPHGGFWNNHKTFYINKDIKLFGGFSGVETEKTQRNWFLNPTVLSGDLNGNDTPDLSGGALWSHASREDNAFHVLWLDRVGDSMILNGFYIEDGNANFPGITEETGGGIYINGSGGGHFSNPCIAYCTFRRNASTYRGGAIFNDGSQGGIANMQVSYCTFLENYTYLQGGAIFNSAEYGGESNPYFLNCTFKNHLSEFDGGAVLNSGLAGGVSSPSFDSCIFENNTAAWYGGAVMNYGDAGVSDPIFADCIFIGNSALRGGAIHNSGIENGQSNPVLVSCKLEGNVAESYGGAVYNNGKDGNANAVITHCSFLNNSTQFQGGAIFNNGDDGTSSPAIKCCFFEGNFAQTGGGAVFNRGNSGISSPLIDSCVFMGNTTQGGGGALVNYSFLSGFVAPLVKQCLFTENAAAAGGAVRDDAVSGVCKPVYSNCTFDKNTAHNGGAVKVFASQSSSYNPTFVNCIFTENSADNEGGAMYNEWKGQTYPLLINCTFWGNTANAGGGLFGYLDYITHPRIINCSFSNNRATTNGGAMFNRTCSNCTTPDFVIQNCIFWDNEAPTGKSMFNFLATPQLFYTLIEETSCLPGAYCGNGVIHNQDPLFQEQNGNMRLQAGSPAINTGQNSAVPDSIQLDLDGNPRIMGAAVDMGAFEFEEASGVKNTALNDLIPVFHISPNPFCDQTKIGFLLARGTRLRIKITDFAGRVLMDMEKDFPAGYHCETFQLRGKVSDGILLCGLSTARGTISKKMVQMRRN